MKDFIFKDRPLGWKRSLDLKNGGIHDRILGLSQKKSTMNKKDNVLIRYGSCHRESATVIAAYMCSVSIALYINYRFNLGIHWVPNWISCTTNYQYQCKICRYLLHTTHLLNIAYWILIQIQSIKSASGSDSLHICHYLLTIFYNATPCHDVHDFLKAKKQYTCDLY